MSDNIPSKARSNANVEIVSKEYVEHVLALGIDTEGLKKLVDEAIKNAVAELPNSGNINGGQF